jgi:hypothetical protein
MSTIQTVGVYEKYVPFSKKNFNVSSKARTICELERMRKEAQIAYVKNRNPIKTQRQNT